MHIRTVALLSDQCIPTNLLRRGSLEWARRFWLGIRRLRVCVRYLVDPSQLARSFSDVPALPGDNGLSHGARSVLVRPHTYTTYTGLSCTASSAQKSCRSQPSRRLFWCGVTVLRSGSHSLSLSATYFSSDTTEEATLLSVSPYALTTRSDSGFPTETNDLRCIFCSHLNSGIGRFLKQPLLAVLPLSARRCNIVTITSRTPCM